MDTLNVHHADIRQNAARELHLSDLGLLIYVIVAFLMSLLSGATGGGGGFIMTPLMIFLGLTPAEAVANGKFGGLSVTIGSLLGLKEHKVSNRKLSIILVVLALTAGLIAPKIIVSIDGEAYETILGMMLMVLSPLIVFKKIGHQTKKVSKSKKIIGLVAIGIVMLLVGIFSGGIGIFINVAMMGLLGMNALDASVTKRYSQLFLNATIIVGLIGSGLFILKVILASTLANAAGGYFGGKLAIKKGSGFVSKMIAVVAFASGAYLVFA